jgi:hypothetical protein
LLGRDEYRKVARSLAWLAYRALQLAPAEGPKDRLRILRRLRKREFEAGFDMGLDAGVIHENERYRTIVMPMTDKVYELVRALEDDPTLAKRLKAEYPETVKRLLEYLRGVRR